MLRKRASSVILAAYLLLVLPAFRSAELELPSTLAGAEALAVSGHNPRSWNHPLAFGPYRTAGVREGLEFSWSAEAFGVRGGQAKKPYRLVLETADGASREVECRQRSIEVWRKGWSVELTDAFRPRLVCGFQSSEGRVQRLVLGSNGMQLRGVVHAAADETPLLTIRSLHRLAGSRLPLGEPAGYALERDGVVVAAVETINRGRVWLGDGLDADDRELAAAAAATLLLYKPDLSPEE